jgi:hypothetical protein
MLNAESLKLFREKMMFRTKLCSRCIYSNESPQYVACAGALEQVLGNGGRNKTGNMHSC